MRRKFARRACDQQAGFVTVEFLAAVALSLVLLTVFVNYMVIQYSEGAVRSAVDEAARSGGHFQSAPPADRKALCEQRMDFMLKSIGRLGDITAAPNCDPNGPNGTITATVEVTFKSWFAVTPDVKQHAVGVAVFETAPA